MPFFQIIDPVKLILNEIKDASLKRDDIALTYAIIILQMDNNINWQLINTMIIERWSPAGLEYIKARAWQIIEQKMKEARGQI